VAGLALGLDCKDELSAAAGFLLRRTQVLFFQGTAVLPQCLVTKPS